MLHITLRYTFYTVHSHSCVCHRSGCGFPDWLKLVMIAYMGTMLFLFGKFFVASYLPKKDHSDGKKKQ